MYCLLNSTDTNICTFIFSKMIDASTNLRGASLPYGMILTKIFRHFDLPLEDEPDTIPISAISEFNSSNLKMMGLVLVNGAWGLWW